jgi:acetyltransferase-like isoleucine patch superfamily enzyme
MRELLNRFWRAATGPRMLYGWREADGAWRAHTRISSSTRIESPATLRLADHVYVGPYNLLDASGGLEIGEGCQITTHCVLLTHSSHQALRLAGRAYFGLAEPPGYVRAATALGAYVFVGPHSVVAPGSRIGKGALVRAFSYVDGEVPAFAIVAGQPAKVVGDTREADAAFLGAHPRWAEAYAAWSGALPAAMQPTKAAAADPNAG